MTADIDIDTNTDSAAPPSEHRHVGAYVEMLISSLIGLVASLILSIEAITLATNPAAVLSCDISSKISCGWLPRHGRPNCSAGLTVSSDSSLNPSSSQSRSRPLVA